MEYIIIAVVIAVVLLGAATGLVVNGRRRKQLPPSTPARIGEPQVGEEAAPPREAPTRAVEEVPLPEAAAEAAAPGAPAVRELDVPEPTAGRLVRLRSRLSRSQNSMGKGLLALLSRDHLDEDTWEEIEETLLVADVGAGPTAELVDRLRRDVAVQGVRSPEAVRAMLRTELLEALDPAMDRSLAVTRVNGRPAVVLVVGVNGTGKTTTIGKLARVLVAEDKDVLLGAADTFRAAAADQLQTWGARVGVPTVRSDRDGADPAAVAFQAAWRKRWMRSRSGGLSSA